MEPPKNETLPEVAAPKETKKKNKKRIIIWLIIFLLLLPIFYYLFKIFLAPQPNDYGGGIDFSQPVKPVDANQNLLLATTTATAKRAKAIATSENFDLLQISLEGSATNVFDLGENEIFTLGGVASELYSVKDGDKSEIRSVISFQTNKRSYAEVEYFKSGEKDKKIVKDSSPGFNHILVIPGLDPDSVYRYSISAIDFNRTEIFSEQFVFYTGAGNISLVDILENAVQKVFGWALRK